MVYCEARILYSHKNVILSVGIILNYQRITYNCLSFFCNVQLYTYIPSSV